MLEVHSSDGTTFVLNDVICNLPKMGGLAGYFLGPTGQASVPRFTRWFVKSGGGALGEHLGRLAGTPNLRRVIMSHGANIDVQPNAALETARATA